MSWNEVKWELNPQLFDCIAMPLIVLQLTSYVLCFHPSVSDKDEYGWYIILSDKSLISLQILFI